MEQIPGKDTSQDEDSAERIKSFKQGMDELEGRFQVKLVVYPQFIPSAELGIFNITICKDVIDVKNRAIPSPYHD